MKNPGWVDLQVNGHNGVDYSAEGLTEDAFLRSVEELHNAGTATFLPTIITSPAELMIHNGQVIMKAVEKHGLSDIVPGLHLEGPFISNVPGAVGAHNPAWTRVPTPENVQQLLDAFPNFLKIVSMGADAEGAPEAIKMLVKNNVRVSVGHHMANYAQVHAAAKAGAKLLTHLGNGCPNLLDRHNNPVWAGLAEEALTAMIITDGHHLPGDLVRIMFMTKGVDKVIVTSDASSLTGFPPGTYGTLGNVAVLEPNGKLHNPEKKCLVGSASTIAMCMEFLESLDFLTEDELKRAGRDNALAMIGLK